MRRMALGALDGLLVLDLAGDVSGAFAGKILRDLGARVVMIEPEVGSPARQLGLFDYLAGGKESVVPSDDAAFGAWLAAADIVLTDGTSPWHARGHGRSPGPHGPRRPVAVRPQRAARRVDVERPRDVGDGRLPLLHRERPTASRSGCPAPTPSCTPPRMPRSPVSSGSTSASAADTARRSRSPSKTPCSTAHAWLVSSWAANGALLARQPVDLIRAKDGWVYVMRIVPKEEIFVMIERPDLMAREPGGRHPDVERQHPAHLRGRPGVGPRQDGRRDRRARAAAARGGHADRRRRRRARRRAAGRQGLVGARGRDGVPRPAVQVLGHARRRAAARRRPSGRNRARRRRPSTRRPSRPTLVRRRVRRPARGHPHPRGHDELGRPRRRPLPRRPRLRQHQGRVGHPAGDARPDLARAQRRRPPAPGPPPAAVLLRDEPQQARCVHRPRQARRPRGVPGARQDGRRRAREQQRPRDAEPRARLRGPQGGQAGHHHGVDVGLRRRRPAPRLGGVWRQHRDDELADVDHRIPRRPAVAHDAVLRRPGLRQLRGGGDDGRPAPPGPDR